MIIGKKDKEKMKQLEETNKLLQSEWYKNAYKEDLLNIIKAIINKFTTQEIIINHEELENAKIYELYVTKEITRFATKYQIVNPKEFLKSFKEE